MPSFAIGRVEEVLYWVKRLEEEGRIPVVPVYVDSPMALEALNFYAKRTDELDDEMSRRGRAVRMFATKRFTVTRSAQESKRITASRLPSIVISSAAWRPAAASCTTSPTACPDPRNTVLFVGFQAEGTRGRQLVDGATEVKIHGRSIPVQRDGRAARRACRRTPIGRDPALADRVHDRAEDHLPRARRAGLDGGAQDRDRRRRSAGAWRFRR